MHPQNNGTIAQLVEKGKCITEIFKLRPKETLHNLWNELKHFMIFCYPIRVDDSTECENRIKPAPS